MFEMYYVEMSFFSR